MSEENLYTFENPEYRKTYWHTCSHVMAQAVKRLWPEVQLAIGPSIAEGWYYDFDSPFSFTQEHLDQIEAEMKKICKERLHLERSEKPRPEAIAYMEEKNEPYKVELIQRPAARTPSSPSTRQGEFTDLCAGPHLDSTGRIKGNAFKLTQCCGAYWRGDSTTGKCSSGSTASPSPKRRQLDEYLRRAGGGPEAGPQQAGPGAGVLHHRGRHRPGPAHFAAQGRQGHPDPAALGGGRGREAGLPARPKPPIWPSGSCTRFPATGITTWTACSSWATPTMRPRNASPCGP